MILQVWVLFLLKLGMFCLTVLSSSGHGGIQRLHTRLQCINVLEGDGLDLRPPPWEPTTFIFRGKKQKLVITHITIFLMAYKTFIFQGNAPNTPPENQKNVPPKEGAISKRPFHFMCSFWLKGYKYKPPPNATLPWKVRPS